MVRALCSVLATLQRRLAEIDHDVVRHDLEHAVAVGVGHDVTPRLNADRFFDHDVVAIDLDLRQRLVVGSLPGRRLLPKGRRGESDKKQEHEQRLLHGTLARQLTTPRMQIKLGVLLTEMNPAEQL
jgi:hypothetical protein